MIFGETIVALSSGRLPAGVAVIRVSGPNTRFVLETICGEAPLARRAALRTLYSYPDKAILDRGLTIYFPAPHSFTGEDVAEFQIHGGRAVVEALMTALTAMPGVRHAEAGEFTRRAFMNGKLDLVQTEALADLINADTEAQRRFAQRNADGAQSALYTGWRQRLIHARAMIEAEIDFADESDVPGSLADTVWADMENLAEDVSTHIKGFAAAEIIQDGFKVVILGAPNAGKSSLFNALARRDVAIVTDEPGTTRDLLDVTLDLGGLKIVITDTAGLRENAGTIEAIGIEKARERSRQADLVLALEDMSAPQPVETDWLKSDSIKVGTKLDLDCDPDQQGETYDLTISSLTGEGVAGLLAAIRRRAEQSLSLVGDVLPTRLRHVELLSDTLRHLRKARSGFGQPLELRAEELRLAADALGRITGAIDVEDLLDVIFSQFCIGK
ncbi:tRNA uridine-5-carboxymethylaminomethyl(34) synthesis GTPase MnmE [Aquamicrobium ahrensii]|uniref:tRNA modification GTPase MnmE n=1 Tax=Aquamicrobium ahrensii TaxID=469551 RepID=A0ABV2KLY6_9HYPH